MMSDMLVKLYELPAIAPVLQRMTAQGIAIRHPQPGDQRAVLSWVKRHFGKGWLPECELAFRTVPAACLIAVRDQTLLGFACYDCTAKNFFGPTGVVESAHGSGIGTALLLTALDRMKQAGYGYAIIGGVGPTAFYAKTVGAVVIEGSSPGIYTEPLTGSREVR
jgi:predicted N-acetyltransferase YhbS